MSFQTSSMHFPADGFEFEMMDEEGEGEEDMEEDLDGEHETSLLLLLLFPPCDVHMVQRAMGN